MAEVGFVLFSKSWVSFGTGYPIIVFFSAGEKRKLVLRLTKFDKKRELEIPFIY